MDGVFQNACRGQLNAPNFKLSWGGREGSGYWIFWVVGFLGLLDFLGCWVFWAVGFFGLLDFLWHPWTVGFFVASKHL